MIAITERLHLEYKQHTVLYIWHTSTPQCFIHY